MQTNEPLHEYLQATLENRPTALFFFFPYRGVGGVSVLFLRIAKAVKAMRPETRVVLIDYPDGYMAKNLDVDGIELLTLKKGCTIHIPEDSLMIVQSLQLWRLPDELHFAPSARLLMWHLHPMNVVPGSKTSVEESVSTSMTGRAKALLKHLLYGPQELQCRQLLSVAQERRAIVFMDQENLDVAEKLNSVCFERPVFVPVPSVARDAIPEPREAGEVLRCAWVGRLEDFKTSILLYTMERLSELSQRTGTRLRFEIVGRGNDEVRIQEEAKRLTGESGAAVFECVGEMSTQALDSYLSTDVDLLFAMGTSALEGAKLGVPTVLLDFSYSDVPDGYKFGFLHDSKGFTLGRVIRGNMLKPGNTSLQDIVFAVKQDRKSMGWRAREYFEKNHAMDSVCQKLLKAIDGSQFTFSEIERLKLNRLSLRVELYLGVRQYQTGNPVRIEVT